MAGSKPAWSNDGRTGPVRDYIDQKVFACEGMVVVIDHRPGKTLGECVVLDCATATDRVKELQKDYRGQTRAQQPQRLRELWTKRLNGCSNIMECVKEARAMGDPADPQVQAFWKRHNTLRIAGYAKAGSRRSREDILSQVADSSVPTTLLQADGTKATIPARPKKLILPSGAKAAPEYTPPVPVRKAAANE